MEQQPSSEYITVDLNNGSALRIEAVQLGGERLVAGYRPAFEQLIGSIAAVSTALRTALDSCKPAKSVVEFGLEVGLEGGQLTAIIARGSAKANIKITLEWSGEGATTK